MDAVAVQSAHTGFIPRVGGLSVYISLVGFLPLMSFGFIPVSVFIDLNFSEIGFLVLSAIPIFVIGLAEDLGYSMSPKVRLLGSAISGLLVIVILNVWILKLAIPGLDFIITFVPFALVFTLFATVGVVNAFNLIDGLNGLSGYVSMSIALSLSIIAYSVGNYQMAVFLVFLIFSVLGFMVLNFPFGKIFLGDGGAYSLGHLLVGMDSSVGASPSINLEIRGLNCTNDCPFYPWDRYSFHIFFPY